MNNKSLVVKPEMRNLLMEIFHTDNEEELKRIASNAQSYERMFQNIPPANIASHFQTSRQTIYKYITPTRRVSRDKSITMRMQYMHEKELCTTIDVDFMNKKVCVDCIEMYVSDLNEGIDYYSKLGLKVLWKNDTSVGMGMEDDFTEILLQNERKRMNVDRSLVCERPITT